VTVAEELHFSRATAQLHVAQPALSSQVRRLELLVGISLPNRSTRNVELAEAGTLFLVKARKALAATEEAIAVATSFGRGEMGELSLGVTPRARHEIAPTALRRLHQDHPGVSVSKREEGTSPLVEDVVARRLNAVIGFCPAPHPPLSRIFSGWASETIARVSEA
jgi:DNA-binding transcriptional LysR family regulator